MVIIQDSREQHGLMELFPKMQGVEYMTLGLTSGDYTCYHGTPPDNVWDTTVVERKSLADCFNSFCRNYEREKAKWERAQAAGLSYMLAIEGTVSDVLAGHAYWKQGEVHEAKKSGLAQIRQLCSIERRYGVQVKYFSSRKEMALWLVEYFLSAERIPTHA